MEDSVNINYELKNEINENTHMVYYQVSLGRDVPSNLCSPFAEDWIGSESYEKIKNYLFDVVFPEFLVDDAKLSGYDVDDDGNVFTLELACHIYSEARKDNKKRMDALESFKELDETNLEKYDYCSFVKYLIKLENVCKVLGMDVILQTFYCPYDARFNKRILNEYFDMKYLKGNFVNNVEI